MYRTLLPLLLLISFIRANTIFYNATIYTVDNNTPWAEAIVYDKGVIVYVGSNTQALSYKHANTTMIDLQGRFVMPGIIDAHTHTAVGALLLQQGVNLTKAKGKKGVLAAIKKYADTHPKERVITGVGFYPYIFGQFGPNAATLDTIVPNRPAFIISNNGHQAWANTKALALLGIHKNTPDPKPGIHYYVRDKEGNPTGFLIEGAAFWPHLATLGIGSVQRFEEVLQNFLPQLLAQGITTVFDAGAPAVETNAFKALRSLEMKNALPIRYFASHFTISADDAASALPTFMHYQKLFTSQRLIISSVKFTNDNSDDDHFAILFPTKELSHYLLPLAANDVDVMIHTSQDESVHQALDAIENVKKRYPHTHSRFTLAHVNMVRESDFNRFSRLGVIANIQPFNAEGEGYYEYRYMLYDEIWENKLVRFKHFLDHNVTLSASSDFPACGQNLQKCSPLYGIQVAVTRQKVGRETSSPILAHPKERLSVQEAIHAYTMGAAYQLHQEHQLGSLTRGKQADLIVLSRNVLAIPPHEIHATKVLMTIISGTIVYDQR